MADINLSQTVNKKIINAVKKLASDADSFYIYDESVILDRISQLSRDFAGVEFLYSIKANPADEILKTIFSKGLGADAASINEVKMAHGLGLTQQKILYSAPGKRRADIEDALGISTIIADSISEIRMIEQIARGRGITAKIGIRINPDFPFDTGNSGIPSKFGIDEKQVFDFIRNKNKPGNIEITGIHVHLKSQELRNEVMAQYYENVLKLACRVQSAIGKQLDFVNMGSGMGIPYSLQDTEIDTKTLGGRLSHLINHYSDSLKSSRIIIETGRFAVGKSGCYVSKVLDFKESMGTKYVILSNTLNGFIKPSIAQMIKHYVKNDSQDKNADIPSTEPLFTSFDASRLYPVIVSGRYDTAEEVTLVGNLCTSADVVAEKISLPVLSKGDLIVMTNAGSYAAVLSPFHFSSQQPPEQFLLRTDESIVQMK